eukprot:2011932-Amphidinium_carterae.1
MASFAAAAQRMQAQQVARVCTHGVHASCETREWCGDPINHEHRGKWPTETQDFQQQFCVPLQQKLTIPYLTQN